MRGNLEQEVILNIVYLLIHKQRLEENNPPYYYIGSKMRWKGQGSYYSSSREAFMKDVYPEDLVFTPIWTSEDCTHVELLEKEKEYQLKHDVIKNPLFFNRNIANSLMFQEVDIEARIAKWKLKAEAVNEDGIKNSVVLAAKGREVTRQRYTPEQLSDIQRAKMYKQTDTGELLKDVVFRKMMETSSKIGEDGLTGFQRGGIKVKETLSEVTGSGLTKAQMRAYYGTKNSKITLFNITFFSSTQACNFFNFDAGTLRRITSKGMCSKETYSVICNLLGEDYMSQFQLVIKNPGNGVPFIVCGKYFTDILQFCTELAVHQETANKFVKNGIIGRRMKQALVEYFGFEVASSNYPETYK